MPDASVVRGQHKFDTLVGVGYISELSTEFANKTRSRCDIDLWIAHLFGCYAEVCCRSRHELHETARSGPRPRVGIEATLLIALRRNEFPIPSGRSRSLFEQRIVDRNDASVTRKEDSLHVSAHFVHLAQAFFLSRLHFGQRIGRKPSAQGFGQLFGVGAHSPARMQLRVVHASRLQTGFFDSFFPNGQRRHVCISALHHGKQLRSVVGQFDSHLKSFGTCEIVSQRIL